MGIESRVLGILTTLLPLLIGGSSAANAMGGMSGGGGNIVSNVAPTTPTSIEKTVRIVSRAYDNVIPYLQNKKALAEANEPTSESFTKLFNSPLDVVHTAIHHPPRIRTAHPCFDQDRVAYDGSAGTNAPEEICISAFRISQKAARAEIESQSMALMVHEYSELVGFTDDEAKLIQNEVLKELNH